jgi:hypothetical protein
LTNTQTKSNLTCIVQNVCEPLHAFSFCFDAACDASPAEPSNPLCPLFSRERGDVTLFHDVLPVGEFFAKDPERRVQFFAYDPAPLVFCVSDPGRLPYSSQQVATQRRLQTQKMR